MFTNLRRFTASAAIVASAALTLAARSDTPHVYAITGARIVTASGAPIPTGTVVIRGGLIEAVGADVTPPADARVYDAKGLTVYPGLIDLGTTTGVEAPMPAQPANPRTTEEIERWKRSTILRPQIKAADHVRVDSPDLERLASAGITSILAMPAGSIVRGQSALINVVAAPDEPQIGNVGDDRSGLTVVKSPVAFHVGFAGGGGGGYPASLMGIIAFVRQAFLDAQHYGMATAHYERHKATGVARPAHEIASEALQPALSGKVPVAFEAGAAREILRALAMAKEFKLTPIITGAREADQVVGDLKAQNAPVVLSLNFPVRPRTLAPDADEPLATLRDRAGAAKTPAALDQAGVLFAYQSGGLREPRDFVRNAARTVKDGLPADAAVRALTINAARIAGAADRLGSIEKGKIANLIVTDGDLFDEKMTLKHVFIDGRAVHVQATPPAAGGRGRGRGGL